MSTDRTGNPADRDRSRNQCDRPKFVKTYGKGQININLGAGTEDSLNVFFFEPDFEFFEHFLGRLRVKPPFTFFEKQLEMVLRNAVVFA